MARRFARLACREASRRHTFRDRYDGLTERYAGAVYNGTGGKRITRTEIEHTVSAPWEPYRPMTFDQISQCLAPWYAYLAPRCAVDDGDA